MYIISWLGAFVRVRRALDVFSNVKENSKGSITTIISPVLHSRFLQLHAIHMILVADIPTK